MNKITRIILLIIVIPCSIFGALLVIDEIVTNFHRIISLDYQLSDKSYIVPFIWILLCFPTILLNLKMIFTRKPIQNRKSFNKLIVTGNILFGLFLISIGIYLFFYIQPNFPINQIIKGWDRYLLVIAVLFLGFIILTDKINVNSIKNWLQNRV